MIAKFIECGVILDDISMRTSKWEKRKRRYPTTNYVVYQLLNVQKVIECVLKLRKPNPGIFEKLVQSEYPNTIGRGRGLIWFSTILSNVLFLRPKGFNDSFSSFFQSHQEN